MMPLSGVIRRHDIPDKSYLSLAKQAPFSPVVQIMCGKKISTGTLISPTKVLVAGHAIKPKAIVNVTLYVPHEKLYFIVSGTAERHPKYSIKHNDNGEVVSIKNDIGLIHLKNPIKQIVPAKLHFDELPKKLRCYICGYGNKGTGITGPNGNDGKRRSFEVILHSLFDTISNFSYYVLLFDEEPTPNLSLTGLCARGDSGAPAFLAEKQLSQTPCVVGIVSLLLGSGKYGSGNIILPLAPYRNFIKKHLRK